MKLQKLKLSLLLLFVGTLGSLLISPKSVLAAPIIYYELNANDGTCEPGDTLLTKPFIRNNKSYYCAVRPEGAAIYRPATGTPPDCPPGEPMFFDQLYGNLCIHEYPGGSPLWGPIAANATNSDTTGPATRVSLDEQADCDPDAGQTINTGNCAIYGYLLTFTNILSGLVAVVIVIMIITGGIQYATSADDPQKVTAAKKRIFNAIFALVAYIFMFAFLQWIVPGGVFNA